MEDEMEDDDICPKSDDGEHEPDWSTVFVDHDGGQAYIDVNCKLCGRSGCVGSEKTLTEDISW